MGLLIRCVGDTDLIEEEGRGGGGIKRGSSTGLGFSGTLGGEETKSSKSSNDID